MYFTAQIYKQKCFLISCTQYQLTKKTESIFPSEPMTVIEWEEEEIDVPTSTLLVFQSLHKCHQSADYFL